MFTDNRTLVGAIGLTTMIALILLGALALAPADSRPPPPLATTAAY